MFLALGIHFSHSVPSLQPEWKSAGTAITFESRFAKSSCRTGHVHGGGHQEDLADAEGGECLEAQDGVFVGVERIVFRFEDGDVFDVDLVDYP